MVGAMGGGHIVRISSLHGRATQPRQKTYALKLWLGPMGGLGLGQWWKDTLVAGARKAAQLQNLLSENMIGTDGRGHAVRTLSLQWRTGQPSDKTNPLNMVGANGRRRWCEDTFAVVASKAAAQRQDLHPENRVGADV